MAGLVQGDTEEQSGTVFPRDSAVLKQWCWSPQGTARPSAGYGSSHWWVQVALLTFRRYMLPPFPGSKRVFWVIICVQHRLLVQQKHLGGGWGLVRVTVWDHQFPCSSLLLSVALNRAVS